MRAIITIGLLFTTLQISIAQCWNLVWADEFDGTSLDLSKWSYQTGGGGWGNNEWQVYTAGPNASVGSGVLSITADYDGTTYTSSRIRSINQGDWTCGKMEASIKMPEGQGIWPAFWMLPTDNVYGTWPASGEIDIMEYLGHQTNITHGTAHWGNAWPDHQYQGQSYTLPSGGYNDGFHTFTVEWEPTEIRWYMDGIQYHSINTSTLSGYHWPFDQKFHFLLNVAVGGNWPGYPDATTMFPQTMEVDWVRVYQEFPDLEMEGEVIVSPGETGLIYSVPDIPGTTYSWSVPAGSSITSGSGTHEITLTPGTTGGDVQVTLNNACGTTVLAKTIDVTFNLVQNPGFEEDLTNWGTNAYNGGWANFNISTTDVYADSKACCAEVTSLGVDPWNIQLSPGDFPIENGEDYTFKFWAKGDQAGDRLNLGIINASTFAYYGGTTFTMTTSWQEYIFEITAPATTMAKINFDLGLDLGTYCIDEVYFSKTSVLPAEWGIFSGKENGNNNHLYWTTLSEINTDYFTIQRAGNDLRFTEIGKIDAAGESLEKQEYYFTDSSPLNSSYYRIQLTDQDGSISYTPVIEIKREKSPRYIQKQNTLEFFNIDASQNISIFGISGERLLFKQITDSEEIDLSAYPPGLYILQFEDGESHKIMVR